MVSLKEKVSASIFLLSYFETLGFNNAEWEFNYGNNNLNINQAGYVWINIIHHFFALGGFSNINITNWNSSDDTILAIGTGLACLKGGTEKDYIKEYINLIDTLKDNKRLSGINTLNVLEFMKRANSINKLDYKETMGGNGAAMRTSIIGLIYYKENQLDKLIENSIIASRVTHNYSLGFLGGLVTALFTSFGIRNIPIWEWVDKLLEIYNQGYIDKYMKKTNIYKKYLADKDFFFDKWLQYQEQKLSKFKFKPNDFIHFENRIESLDDYNDYKGKRNKEDYSRFGSSGLSCVLVAYDALLMSINSKENIIPINLDKTTISIDSLIFFSCLHFGDNDTTGAVAGAWYGSVYGFLNFDQDRLKQLEFYHQLKNISDRVINKL